MSMISLLWPSLSRFMAQVSTTWVVLCNNFPHAQNIPTFLISPSSRRASSYFSFFFILLLCLLLVACSIGHFVRRYVRRAVTRFFFRIKHEPLFKVFFFFAFLPCLAFKSSDARDVGPSNSIRGSVSPSVRLSIRDRVEK